MRNMMIKMMWMRDKAMEAVKDESGMGVIEIAIIIIVLIAIAIAFRGKIISLVQSLLDGMELGDATSTTM